VRLLCSCGGALGCGLLCGLLDGLTLGSTVHDGVITGATGATATVGCIFGYPL
jgi:hypothetical protein